MEQVNILEAKNRLSELVRSVAEGDEVVIANRGVPVARLIGIQQAKPDPEESPISTWLKTHPMPPHARRSLGEIDADLRRERDAWD